MVVPVWLSSSNNVSTEKLVYVLLDSQSDTTFIDQEAGRSCQVKTDHHDWKGYSEE